MNNGGDRIAFHLDAEPDRNKFDVAARVNAPADGLLPGDVRHEARRSNLVDRRQGQLDALARHTPRSTFRVSPPLGWRWAWTRAAIGCRASGRRRHS